MRFRQLSLERFGHFDGCELTFRAGAPDLHVIYGGNEAGKTTSMAAVADLLFGFEARARYHFQFDPPLLRIGAMLEEDGRVVAVRRRRAKPSLVDAADKPIDDGLLAAMLHGQTREGFRLAFSLDHLRLREGGRAIVQARDDIGQTLFAAGSGMTGVVATLAAIEGEAEAIWGPRRAQKRSYTQAESAYEVARTEARDRQVKPKAWSDAQGALRDAETARASAEAGRDLLLAEQRQVERMRRIGPAMRRRADLLAGIAAAGDVPMLPPAREERVLAALKTLSDAERDRATAATLLADVDVRRDALAVDVAVLAEAEAIEELVERRGAIAKARGDADRLLIEHRVKEVRVVDLRRDLELEGRALPSRPVVSRLRALATSHGEAVAALRTVEETQEELRARLGPLEHKLAATDVTQGLAELSAAVADARRLGDDVDARCAQAVATASLAGAQAEEARVRLVPWSGDAAALLRVSAVAEAEIASVEAELARVRQTRRTAAEDEQRLGEEIAALALDREALADSGQAIAATELAEARSMREAQWHELRDGLRGVAPLADPVGASDAYERAVIAADALADRRFALAEGSGQLGLLDQQAAGLELRRTQALGRRDVAAAVEDAVLAGWQGRLGEAGLPPFEPARLRAWIADRAAALDAQALAMRSRAQATEDIARRQAARSALAQLMPDLAGTDASLAPALHEGERRMAAGEARDAAYRADHAQMRQLTDALATHARQTRHRTDERTRAEGEWREASAALGLSLAIGQASVRLPLIEELRAVEDEAEALATRLRGIETDRLRFEADLAALSARLGEAGESGLDALRARLAAARAGAGTRAALDAEHRRRQGEAETAQATRDAAAASLAPIIADLDGVAIEALDEVVQVSRRLRGEREALAVAEAEAARGGEGHALDALDAQWHAADPDAVAARADALGPLLADANARVAAAAEAAGEAKRAFAALDLPGGDAAGAAGDAEQARAEMAAQAEAYLLKRAQALTLRWAIERYRQERQDPLLVRASALFRRLTLGRFAELRIDHDAAAPRLLGVRDDGRQAIDVEAMSDGTADQLFLALRLAAAEQSVAAGVRLPFLADDLFINFDDDRARAGFEVLSELAATTQVLFFTHHAHLADIARDVAGADLHSECRLS